ncbi:DUF5994 family protein [Streptomyces calvus]|uniref:Uncharacterized protein n=2 Tax=Streptomyces TaxID=1883 RepID=A0A514JML1_9ACTN|nr:DUF5994 family protein [Streptomyces calvus]MBA8946016.1 hypothetical protein [Streptomyces calvus]QDI68561.1 hypothetical protein CD934_07615 [Streptomyces calvus]GGP64198.1 hypothetical protein GCM10010247_41270 [Streptomyces calvus]
MTATIFRPTTFEGPTTSEGRLSAPPPRLSLAPAGCAPALLDGAWWPRTRDLHAELPALAAVLDPLWGRITRITVNPARWPVVPRKVPVGGHMVKVGWFRAEQDPHELLLLSYHVGRWNLLVVPPETDPVPAAWLMSAASDPRRTETASRLMADAPRPRSVAGGDRIMEAVRESEGGREAGVPAASARARTLTAAIANQLSRA